MKRLFLIPVIIIVLLSGCLLSGCLLQINPNSQEAKYETFGRNLGTYVKNKHPEFVAKSNTYVKGVLELSDEELIGDNVLQTAYDYAMENYPNDAELILLVKSGLDVYGVTIDLSKVLPDSRPLYIKSVRALVKGYYEASKMEL